MNEDDYARKKAIYDRSILKQLRGKWTASRDNVRRLERLLENAHERVIKARAAYDRRSQSHPEEVELEREISVEHLRRLSAAMERSAA